jgi:hypothetical protein
MKNALFILLLIKTIMSLQLSCDKNNPLSPNECWEVKEECCYLVSDTDARCGLVDNTHINIKVIDKITYRVYCDNQKTGEPNTACLYTGLPPDSYKDCLAQSTSSSSCCYFSDGNTNGCFFGGSSQYGNTKWNNMTIICSGNYYSISILFLIILFIYKSSSFSGKLFCLNCFKNLSTC